jgi:predicted DNA-binding antitoxin AbrB/MazE fold protein
MAEIVTAVYEKGTLRLLQPLNLRECQTVRIQVLPEELAMREGLDDGVEEVIQSLVARGLMRDSRKSGAIPPDPLSAEERKALADRLGGVPGKSASEMVIEDRCADDHLIAVARAEGLLADNPNHHL